MNIDSREALVRHLDQHGLRFHKIGVFDIDGIFRGKYVDRDKFLSTVDHGFGFCDVVLGWDSGDQLYDNAKVSGWHTGYRDAPVTLDLDSLRTIPGEPETSLMLGRFAGAYSEVCPRNLLRRVAQRAKDMGFVAQAALEYEFFLFNETPKSARAKGYRDLEPITPGMFGYSVLRSSVHHELYHELLDHMRQLGCPIEGLHTETGPGVIEAALKYAPLEEAGDRAALFKTFAKVWAQRRGLMATFMSKWSPRYPGQSGHIHLSLCDVRSGDNLFHHRARSPHPTPASPSPSLESMSPLLRHFVAGQVALMPELLPMVCSTVNAYRRLIPGFWAPTHANWGVENRTGALRVIFAGEKATRTEYRVAPADANPYLALAAALASGLWGIERKLEPPPAIEGNGYEYPGASAQPLPRSLGQATAAFSASHVARELFGPSFVEHFAATREWEEREFQRHIGDWELTRYFEII